MAVKYKTEKEDWSVTHLRLPIQHQSQPPTEHREIGEALVFPVRSDHVVDP